MNKNRLKLRNVVAIAICLTAVTMFSGCEKPEQDTDPIAGSSVYKDNYVVIRTCFGFYHGGNLQPHDPESEAWNITGGTFTLKDFHVTTGQDPDNHLKKGNSYVMDSKNQFLFVLGRKKSKEVANSFNVACPHDRNTFNHTAGELNFWMKGDLKLTFKNGLTYTFQNIFLAQGHSGLSNNWWFGADNMTNSQKKIIAYDFFNYYITDKYYLGQTCFGYISPLEQPNLIFKFQRGDGLMPNDKNAIDLIGLYTKKP